MYDVHLQNGEYQFYQNFKLGESFLGTVETDFPVKYPLITTSGEILPEIKKANHIVPSNKIAQTATRKKDARKLIPEIKDYFPDDFPEVDQSVSIFPDDFPDFPKAEPSIRRYAVLS